MQINIQTPSTLREINLSQYKAYIKAINKYQDSDTQLRLKMLEIFCNVPYNNAIKFKAKDVTRITNRLVKLLEETPELVTKFEMGDTKFGFIPKLDDMSFGEYIDLDSSISDWDIMNMAMAVLYRPIDKEKGKFYTIKDYEGDIYHEAMNNMPLDAVISSIVFFYRLGNDLSKSMMRYLEEENQMDSTQLQALEESGVGINLFTHSLKETLRDSRI